MKPIGKILLLLAISFSLILTAFQNPCSAAQEKAKPTAAKPSKSVSAQPATSAKVSLNTATAKDLETLPGIGPKIAQDIVAYREAQGPFKSLDDLKKVKGVGAKKFDKIKDRIALE